MTDAASPQTATPARDKRFLDIAARAALREGVPRGVPGHSQSDAGAVGGATVPGAASSKGSASSSLVSAREGLGFRV